MRDRRARTRTRYIDVGKNQKSSYYCNPRFPMFDRNFRKNNIRSSNCGRNESFWGRFGLADVSGSLELKFLGNFLVCAYCGGSLVFSQHVGSTHALTNTCETGSDRAWFIHDHYNH